MKYLILCMFLFSCSHQSPQPSKMSSNRLPASAEEFERYEYGDNSEIRLTSAHLENVDLEKYSFADFIAAAQKNNYKKIIIDPSDNSPFKKVSSVDDSAPAGDFIALIGTNFSSTDEVIRKGDYDDIYVTAKRLSWLKFRVTINLVASVTDLRNALKNDRPTILMWTSHGNDQYFYDFNQIRVPYSVFKNTSPNIYQFVLTSCNGFTAIQNGYKKFMPPTMNYSGWERLVYHPTDVKAHLESKEWSPYTNYPASITYNGMACKKTEDGYSVVYADSGAVVPGTTSEKFENCMYVLMNSDKNYICSQRQDGTGIYNYKTKILMAGSSFDNSYDCVSRITNSIEGKVCRRLSDNFVYYVDSRNNISQQKFESIDACFGYIQNTDEI